MHVLLTGATGFVGAHLYPALVASGCEVRCATRDPFAAQRRHPDRRWVRMDVEDPASVATALAGCDAAFYLIHRVGQGADYPAHEATSARVFLGAAEAAGVRRIVYLGGVLPAGGAASTHLGSRRRTGELLRAGGVSVVELRAAMIIGVGSVSWTIVRDLSVRLPAMILPRWLGNCSYPVFIDDVVWGMLAALHAPGDESRIYELPGPERIAHRDVLRRIARLRGDRPPMVNVPVLSPRLSSYWIAWVTRVSLDVARELVEGLRYDLEPQGDVLWSHVAHRPVALEEAASLALRDELASAIPSPAAVRRARDIGRQFQSRLRWAAS